MAAIQRPHGFVRAFGHAETIERGGHAGLCRAPGQAMQRGEIHQVAPHRQVKVKGRGLEDHAHPRQGRPRRRGQIVPREAARMVSSEMMACS